MVPEVPAKQHTPRTEGHMDDFAGDRYMVVGIAAEDSRGCNGMDIGVRTHRHTPGVLEVAIGIALAVGEPVEVGQKGAR